MRVLIDDNAGFCFGVVNAIRTAEEHLRDKGTLYCLGDIVHNSAEVERLRNKGLRVIDHDQWDRLSRDTHSDDVARPRVMIRAHGEPPSTYAKAHALGIELIDATCPMVLGLQHRIRHGYEEMQCVNGQVVIFGKPGHAEVIGLTGQTDNTAIVVSNPDDLDLLDFSRPIRLFSQTTKSKEDYDQLKENIRSMMRNDDFVAYDTICGRVMNRTKSLEEFARRVDVLLFVGGANSSNAHYLYDFCCRVQQRSFFLSNLDELQRSWYEGATTVGISGATSTPRWLMEQLRDRVLQL
ncbi:MAG: 4-hydroxy-3-methylbut-2-enyl diphosphate reductase [Bacteroidales bacterium]|nr:4-hydroxy-3-methylbut-2-enyl diphosphate reductase [Bacteroidales bacterium]